MVCASLLLAAGRVPWGPALLPRLLLGVQALPTQLREGKSIGLLIDQAQHHETLEGSRIGLEIPAVEKIEQFADFAWTEMSEQTSNHDGGSCSPLTACEDRHRAHCLGQRFRGGSVLISQPRRPEALVRGKMTLVRKRPRGMASLGGGQPSQGYRSPQTTVPLWGLIQNCF